MCLCARLFWAHSPHSCIFSSERHSVHARMCARLWGSEHAITCVCVNVACVSVCSGVCMRVHACVCVFWQWSGEQDEEAGGEFVCSGPLV